MMIEIQLEDYFGNTEQVLRFSSAKRIQESSIYLKGYNWADTEIDTSELQLIRLQKEEVDE
jgi:hypothetical protein